jgi:hypothetical protein
MIDTLISFLRKIFDSSRDHWENYEEQVYRVCGFKEDSEKKWHFIIDSLYLLEDTSLAKSNFKEFGLLGPTKYKNKGEQYLRLYGIYNACYLEKQAIYKLLEMLQISYKKVDEFEIFQFRKYFASHTVNVGKKQTEHSYILCRQSLEENVASGYSSNAESQIKSLKATNFVINL